MSYFDTNYEHLTYPLASPDREGGLYNAQIGAIHSVASHFTINDEPAIVTMPTGSGKTAVLMMTPFLLKSIRVLVITPSSMVRDQITEDFETLGTLIKTRVLHPDISLPKVHELKDRITSVDDWDDLREYDVVVSTPNCTSPGYENIPAPPSDLFDLVLLDEAHHSPAHTWKELLAAFPNTKKVLFTATPFRRDNAEIRGRFVYSYPIARAYHDKIFGKITYIPVEESPDDPNNDLRVARTTAQVFADDRNLRLNHFVMVRTDSRKRADELAKLYRDNTSLRLEVIHSGHSNRRAKTSIQRLKAGELDGIICVNMLGEGFNFPNLKIAAIHSPHKSLEVTLQFIGRFARTNAPDIGDAKFIAALNDIEIEGQRLFAEGAIWQEIIVGMSHGKVAQEVQLREVLQDFDEPTTDDVEMKDLSMYSIYPRSHVKIYELSAVPDITTEFSLRPLFEILYRNVNSTSSTVVLITQETSKPRWSTGDQLLNLKHELIVVYYDKSTNLLFINSSKSINGLYDLISEAFDANARSLPMRAVARVAKDVSNPAFFNIGMRNIQASNNAESYRIISGSNSQATLKPSDGRLYRQGHAFLSGESEGKRVTIGYSSGGKVWSSSTFQIPDLLDWCKTIGKKIRSTGEIVTNSGFDFLSKGKVATEIPPNITFAQWDKEAFDYNNPVRVSYVNDKGKEVRAHISELDLEIDSKQSDTSRIRVNVVASGITVPIDFTLSDFFSTVEGRENEITIYQGEDDSTLIEYLNEYYLDFFTANGSLFRGNELFEVMDTPPLINQDQIETLDWTNVDIRRETGPANEKGISIHEALQNRLEGESDLQVILYDDGSGEVADYVSMSRRGDTLKVSLYHCKGSKAETPGSRVGDLYEVCGQAQKCLIWTNRAEQFLKKITDREKRGSPFVRGSLLLAKELLSATGCKKDFEVVIVQPGVSKASLSTAMSENLGATSDHVRAGGCLPLRVICSA
jgi:superfamily II DNA or RNA helicase